MKKILCVCGLGKTRSKYLASYLKNKGYSTRFGGIDKFDRKPKKELTQNDVDWADIIILVRKRFKKPFTKNFKIKSKQRIIILDVTASQGQLPKKFAYLKEVNAKEFHKEWTIPQLKKQIKKYLPL